MREWLALIAFILEPILAIFLPVTAVYTLVIDISLAGYVILGGVAFVFIVTILRPIALEVHSV